MDPSIATQSAPSVKATSAAQPVDFDDEAARGIKRAKVAMAVRSGESKESIGQKTMAPTQEDVVDICPAMKARAIDIVLTAKGVRSGEIDEIYGQKGNNPTGFPGVSIRSDRIYVAVEKTPEDISFKFASPSVVLCAHELESFQRKAGIEPNGGYIFSCFEESKFAAEYDIKQMLANGEVQYCGCGTLIPSVKKKGATCWSCKPPSTKKYKHTRLKPTGKWEATIWIKAFNGIKGRNKHVGNFKTEVEAAAASDAYVRKNLPVEDAASPPIKKGEPPRYTLNFSSEEAAAAAVAAALAAVEE